MAKTYITVAQGKNPQDLVDELHAAGYSTAVVTDPDCVTVEHDTDGAEISQIYAKYVP